MSEKYNLKLDMDFEINNLKVNDGDVLVFKIGNLEKGILPSSEDLQMFSSMIESSIGDKLKDKNVDSLFIPPFIKIEKISGFGNKEKVIVKQKTTNRLESIEWKNVLVL